MSSYLLLSIKPDLNREYVRKSGYRPKPILDFEAGEGVPNSKAAPRGALLKRCFKNMQQIYRGTPMPKCDFYLKSMLV